MAKLEDIYNFAQVDEDLATAGQPTEEQFKAVADAGYSVVINLASGTTEDDLKNESQIVMNNGMVYYHIPVDWKNPTTEELEQFFEAMDTNAGNQIFVHCIANYRVSAFTMLYRVIKEKVPLTEAKAFKDKVWNPEHVFPVWDQFIASVLIENGIENT